MPHEKIDPDTLARPHGFAQVVVAQGSRIVVTSGQVGVDTDGKLVGSDHRSQAQRAAENVYAAVAAAGGTPADIVRLMIYVVDPTEATLNDLYQGLAAAAREAGAGRTAMTLVGVTALSEPGWLVELDATAILD
ncbi:enamine deaminase RidA [Amycolatopsis deserti]|uniref:Enamine deaminase RidA n=1 Tax=Amycolatopsis deserti TaxID=185696 RepID=A0ABQ3IPZ7_9PSEU|nr:RidA family protein [Amycolatopsis deserti]GHE88808.1 enamine deaminase RidA [Amycolatopsis deserti]